MENVAHSGFELFAQSIKRKMNWSQRLDPFSHILRDAARPAWEKLTLDEKEEWLARAKELERTDQRKEFVAVRGWRREKRGGPRGRAGRVRTTRNIHFRGVMEEEQEEEDVEEFEFAGVIANRVDDDPDGDVTIPAIDTWLDEKHERDEKRVEGWLRGMTKKQMVELRWLILSVQTYGRNEKECLLAEIALDEFTLLEGVVDRMTTIVSDWNVDNPILKSRAIFHANETHEIPLDHQHPHINKVDLIAEILGRLEPSIAKKQNVSVGLYSTRKGHSSEDGLSIDRLTVDDHDDQFVSTEGRRPILVLRQEYYAATESLLSFKKRVRLPYEGFPVDESRFILAEAFVEAVAAELDGRPMDKFDQVLSELGKRMEADFATQWEKKDELFCKFHAERKNSCCAAVTAARAIFIMIFALEKLIRDES
ncbi:hypothetical protein PMAYCL1PPCAC_18596, partial [Pristionchus mayeri]